MTGFLGALVSTCKDFYRARGPREAVKRTLAVMRVVFFPHLMLRMWRHGYLDALDQRRAGLGEIWDPLHFMSHRDYLARGWSLAHRFDAALWHYRHESHYFDEAYLRQAYGKSGLRLWSQQVGAHSFEIQLRCADDMRREGDLHVVTLVDGKCVAKMAFVWTNGALFGHESRPAMFISRNQSHRCPELEVFRTCFKQNSPPYFCFAALCGIAQAEGMQEIYGVHHARQISFQTQFTDGFRHSYSEFWAKFGGQNTNGIAYRIALPVQLNSLNCVAANHRGRAERRRAHWADISRQAGEVIAGYRRAAPLRAARPLPYGSRAATWLLAPLLPGWCGFEAIAPLLALA